MVWVLVAILVIAGGSALVVAVGYALPKAHSASRTAHFNRSTDEIWAVIADFAGQPSWRTDVRNVERLPDRRGHQIWREIDRRGQAISFETVESVRPRRLVRRIADENLAFSGSWTLELAEYGEVSSLTITEDGEVYNPVFRFVSRFIAGHTATIDKYLTALGKKLGVEVHITGA